MLTNKIVFAALFIACLSSASGAPYLLTFTGGVTAADALDPASGPVTNVTDGLPLRSRQSSTIQAHLAPPFFSPHFVAYSPISATILIGGQTYRVTTAAEDSVNGVAVVIFDKETPFCSNRFAVGFIQDVPADSACIVGDWSSASPDYIAANLVPTTLQDFNGTGFRSGPPQTPGDVFGPALVRPIPLWIGSDQYHLTLHLGQHEYVDGPPLNTAVITAIPEPATFGYAALAIGLLLTGRHKRSTVWR